MVTEIYATGKNISEAVEALKSKLCVDSLDDIEWKVVSAGKKGGLFGIGAVPAKLVAFVETKIEETEAKAESSEPVKPETAKPVKPVKSEPVKIAKAEEAKAEKTETAKPAETKAAVGEKKQQKPKNDFRKNDNHRVEKTAPTQKSEPKPKKPKTPTTDAELAAATDFINALIKNLEVDVTVTHTADGENGDFINISGPDAGTLIGHHGETLDALQYLANLAANRAEGKDDHERISLDVDGYRAKREETLRALARRQAAKVLKYNKSIALEPMNPYERRIIHSEIQDVEGVSTNSVGSDTNRKVVIFPTATGMVRPMRRDNDRRGQRKNSHRSANTEAKIATTAETLESSADAFDAE